MVSGWIKLHRKIMENPVVCKDGDFLAVWVYLLLNATHKEQPALFKGKKIMLKPGQLITGRRSISKELSISESKIQRILSEFENEQQIEQQTSNKNRLVTIVSWDKYQMVEHQEEQQMNNKRTTNEQQVNTNKNVINKELNNIYIADFESKFEAFWSKYPKKQGKAKAKEKMLKYHEQGLDWDKVMQGLESYIAYIAEVRASGFDRQYMDGSTFVNQRRWEDDWTAQSKTPYKPTFKKVAPIPLVQLTKEEEARLEWVYRKRGII